MEQLNALKDVEVIVPKAETIKVVQEN